MASKNPPGDPMTLGNMRRLGVRGLAGVLPESEMSAPNGQ
jgi:hypothetical protein